MRILLVKPHSASDHIQPALGLGYLASAVRNRHEVKILDCIKEDIDIEKLPGYIRAFMPDVLGIQCYTFNLEFVKEAFAAARQINPGIVNITGGPHPSATPCRTLEFLGGLADFAFRGEAEEGLPLLLERIGGGRLSALGDIPGLVWRNNGKIIVNTQSFPDSLDSLGMPAWDLIRPQDYPEAQHGAFFKKFPIAPIMITRGCPYLCTFCAGSVVSGKKIRKRSVAGVLAEMRLLYDKFGIREFHIVDDNFTADKQYAKELLNGIIGLNLDISLATPNGVRLDSLDEELLALFKRSGLYLISLGIESGSDRVLKLMRKNLNIEKIRSGIRMIRAAGIDVAGFFIIGFPGEDVKEIKKTIRFSRELGLIRANYFTYLPFPGTESYRQLESSGELSNVDWERFYFTSASYAPAGLTHKKLKNLQRSAFLNFYMRPEIFFRNLRSIKNLRHLSFLLKRFIHWVVMK